MATQFSQIGSNPTLHPLRDWQVEALGVSHQKLIVEERDHLYVSAPTASGKSRFMYELSEAFPLEGARVIIVGLEQIAAQLKDDFRNEYGCSSTIINGITWFLSPTGQKIYIGTYQGLAALAKRLHILDQAPDWNTALLFFDEIHVGGSNSQGCTGDEDFVDQSSVQRIFGKFQPRKRVYVSATTQTADEKILGKKLDHFYRYPMSDAFKAKILNPVDMIEMHVGTTMKIKRVESQYGRNFEELETLSDTDLNRLADQIRLRNVSLNGIDATSVRWLIQSRHREMIKLYAAKHHGEQAIFYCPKIEDADRAAKDFNDYMNSGAIRARNPGARIPRALDYHTQITDANQKLAAFESGEIQVLFVVGKLQEGFNMPLLQYAFDCRFHRDWNAAKLARFVQKIGRLMRIVPGKGRSRYYFARDVSDFITTNTPDYPLVSEDEPADYEINSNDIAEAGKAVAQIVATAEGAFEVDGSAVWDADDIEIGISTTETITVMEGGFADAHEIDVTQITQKPVKTIVTPMFSGVDAFGQVEKQTFDFVSIIKCRSTDVNKKALLDMAPGDPKPKGKHPLAAALANYTRSTLTVYDAVFDQKIREKQPQWFAGLQTRNRKSKDQSEKSMTPAEKKELLLNMEPGAPRPVYSTTIGTALANYTSGASAHDPIFDAAIRTKQPQWFVKNRVNKADPIRAELLAIPAGAPKPPVKSPLYRKLRDYTSRDRGSFNEEFNKAIREKQPHWFVNCWA